MVKSPNPIDRHVGTRLRMRRVEAGLSQEKLGDALGITFQQIQKYEKGTNRIGASRLQLAAKILAVPVNYFFEGADAELDATPILPLAEVGEAPATFARSPQGLLLLNAFLKIKEPKLRKKIIDLIGAMATENKD